MMRGATLVELAALASWLIGVAEASLTPVTVGVVVGVSGVTVGVCVGDRETRVAVLVIVADGLNVCVGSTEGSIVGVLVLDGVLVGDVVGVAVAVAKGVLLVCVVGDVVGEVGELVGVEVHVDSSVVQNVAWLTAGTFPCPTGGALYGPPANAGGSKSSVVALGPPFTTTRLMPTVDVNVTTCSSVTTMVTPSWVSVPRGSPSNFVRNVNSPHSTAGLLLACVANAGIIMLTTTVRSSATSTVKRNRFTRAPP
jgi:hypothetical protein